MRTTILRLLFVLALAPAANAADIKGEPVLKNRHLYRADRHEITPILGLTLLDHYRHHVLIGVSYKYFVFDWLGVGAEALYAAPIASSLAKDIDDNLGDITLQSSKIQFLANALVEFVPLSGKAMILSSVPFAYDFHVVGGAGFASVKGEGSLDDDPGFSPMFGGGLRFFVTPGIAVSLEVRDYLVSMVEAGSREALNKSPSFVHNISFMMGVNFLLPFEYKSSKN
jgi:outer membrane beta-barrel protein